MSLFQNEFSCTIFPMKKSFTVHENEPVGKTHFHMYGFARRKTRFDTEAKDNSEVAYYFNWFWFGLLLSEGS